MQRNSEDLKNAEKDESMNCQKYLLFKIGSETYGSPLISVREVIKHACVKAVPYMVEHFLGLINLRGQVVGIVDLRLKFGFSRAETVKGGLILIVETVGGLLGCVVDDLVCVREFQEKEIEKNPALETKVPLRFFMGVAKGEKELVNLIDLAGSLGEEELKTVRAKAA